MDEEMKPEFVIFASSVMPIEVIMYFLLDNDIEYRILLDSYDGEKGISYIVPYDRIKDIMQAGLLDKEEDTLILEGTADGTRKAYIHDLSTNEITNIGTLVNVARGEAEAELGWSYDPLSKAFFVVVPNEQEQSKHLNS